MNNKACVVKKTQAVVKKIKKFRNLKFPILIPANLYYTSLLIFGKC